MELQFCHFPVVSGGEGRGGACRPREGDRGEPGTVLDGVEVEASDAVAAVAVGIGGGVVVEGEVARLLSHRQNEPLVVVADGADPPFGRHGRRRPVSDWNKEIPSLY